MTHRNAAGRLLIASPYLTDGNFLRSVIFMIRHDTEGAFGLVINRPTERRFRELVDDAKVDADVRDDDWIYRGGPVDGPLLALHNLAGIGEPCGPFDDAGQLQPGPNASGENELPDGSSISGGSKFTIHDHPAEPFGSMSIELAERPAWITGDDNHLRILLRRPDAHVKYVAHYSGWGAGQLDHELDVGGWLIGEADSEVLFGDPGEAWEAAVKKCGHQILTEMAPGVQPGDPNLN